MSAASMDHEHAPLPHPKGITLKRQPEGIPTGGQFAADRKSEPAGSLAGAVPSWEPSQNNWADMSESVPAPAGLEDLPGHWAPAGGGIGKDYTSPDGTSLVVFTAEDEGDGSSDRQGVIFESEEDDSESFRLTPHDDSPVALRGSINQALTLVSAQNAAGAVFGTYNNVYERNSAQAEYIKDEAGNKELSFATIGFKDEDNARFLEMTHDYAAGTTTVTDVGGPYGDLSETDSDIERDAILVDLARDDDHKTGDAHKELFAAYKLEFDQQPERFGLD